VPPLPPVYGTVAVPVKAVPAVAVAEKVAEEQLKAVTVAEAETTSSSLHPKIKRQAIVKKLVIVIFRFIFFEKLILDYMNSDAGMKICVG
jgi:hypothetical protein